MADRVENVGGVIRLFGARIGAGHGHNGGLRLVNIDRILEDRIPALECLPGLACWAVQERLPLLLALLLGGFVLRLLGSGCFLNAPRFPAHT